MPSFNKVMMIGNLTRDPLVKNLSGGLVVAEFGLAMNRRYRTANGEDKEEVCFVDCSAFGKQAETIVQWCRKGKQLFVEGRLRYDQWEDQRTGGAKRSKITVVVENFQFLGSRDDVPASLFGGSEHRSYDSHGRGNGSSRPAPAAAERGNPRANPGDAAGERADRPEKPEPAEAERGDKPDRRPPTRGSRAPTRQAEQPFGEEKMFEEADIPF
jgi:single-strand DNA-binding protein